MPNRSNYLPFIVLAGLAVALALSCTQPTDVVTPVSSTTLSLVAERMPTTPSGMIYELWAAGSNDTVPLGQFLYNADSIKFYDSTGADRSNQFVLNDDLLKKSNAGYVWQSVFVSVETAPKSGGSHGPIMLIDQVTNPDDDPIILTFPLADSLNQAALYYNVDGASDRNAVTGRGQGLWFSRYAHILKRMQDTLSVAIDSSLPPSPIEDTTKEYPCHVKSVSVETTYVTFGSDTLLMGYDYHTVDTVKKIAVRIEYEMCKYGPPYRKASFAFTWDTVPHVADLSVYGQAYEGLPDYTPYGFKYKGWIVSTAVPKSAVGSFTPPPWKYKGPTWNFMPGDTGGLLTTGTFSSLTQPDDDGNPYGYPKSASSMYAVSPPCPGGDFLDGAAMAGPLHGLNYVQLAQGLPNQATVFISLEPVNFVGRNTNFPLIFAMRDLPTSPYALLGDTVTQDMYNKASYIRGDLQGLPAVYVTLQRY
jgi:hypothetical protein